MVSRRSIIAALLGVLLGCTRSEIPQTSTDGRTQAPTDVSLPASIVVTPPAPGTNSSAAVFSGGWVGTWRWPSTSAPSKLSHVLIVEEIAGDTAYVVYAWGRSTVKKIEPGWVRKKADIRNGVLIVDLSSPGDARRATYTPASDGTLTAIYYRQGKDPLRATMGQASF